MLSKIRQKLLESLSEALYADLDLLIQEEVAENLNNLDKISQTSTSTNSEAWRPSGMPKKDIIAHDTKVLVHLY